MYIINKERESEREVRAIKMKTFIIHGNYMTTILKFLIFDFFKYKALFCL